MIKKIRVLPGILAALVTLTSIGINSSAQAQSAASKELDSLVTTIWEYESKLQQSRPADISPAALASQHEQFARYLKQINQVPVETLSEEEKITLLMQRYRLKNEIDQYEYGAYKVPLTSEYGFHSALATLPQSTRFSSIEDYRNYLSQLERVATTIDQNIAYMQQGLDEGYTQPKAVLQGYEKSVTPMLVKRAEESVFYQPFHTPPAQLEATAIAPLRQQAKQLIEQQIIPAYQRYYDFLVSQYIPGARDSIAATDWPDGKAYYQNRIAYYTTTEMTASEIHQLGLKEVKRIRAQMQTIVDELKFDGDIDQFIHFLRTDPQFYATSATALLKQAAYIAKQADASLPALFEKLPRVPYGVAPVPDDIAPKYTTGRYIHPANDAQPGYYWVNTYALDKRPLYALAALTLHEAVPGHHLQISLADEMENLPAVRRQTYISAFGEGWGLYAEFLGIEAGIYTTAYDNFGRLSYEMWRACRLVVDTGMHMFGWSRQQAIDYMMKNTALSEHNITTEVDRYISWPAQALSYKIGEIKIKQLRRQAEQALGDEFDVREFHTAVLAHGSVPLFVLEQNINTFIDNKKTGNL